MKFVHIADMHFGTNFRSLQGQNDFIQKRWLKQREVFKQVIQYIKENQVEHLFISGDLFEHDCFGENKIM